MSTAESELLGYCEAMQMSQSLEALLVAVYGDGTFEKLIAGDNTSALSILSKPDGSWRTSHLRLRSNCLKEKLNEPNPTWRIHHQRGSDLCADFLTKAVTPRPSWICFGKSCPWSLPLLRVQLLPPCPLRKLRRSGRCRSLVLELWRQCLGNYVVNNGRRS